jgi:uncharacterized protein (TIGR02145 family)
MKKKFISTFIIALSITTGFAQDTMYVRQKVGGWLKLPISNIDSVGFKMQNTFPLTDIDGNTYTSVTIGTQTWMAQNLNTTRFNDGTSITVSGTLTSGISQLPMMCWYNNDKATYSVNKYGALYNWHAVNSGKLCPKGWHVPSSSEWTTLVKFLGDSTLSGGYLKEAGFSNWNSQTLEQTIHQGLQPFLVAIILLELLEVFHLKDLSEDGGVLL